MQSCDPTGIEFETLGVLKKSLWVLSHMPHLVRVNRTRVRFPSWYGSFGQVRMQQSHSDVHQKRTKQAYRDLLEEVVSACFQTNPGAGNSKVIYCLKW